MLIFVEKFKKIKMVANLNLETNTSISPTALSRYETMLTDKKEVFKHFIANRRSLFWSVSDDKLAQISDALLVETILNYGTAADVRTLFECIGIEQIAAIFYAHTENKTRTNYLPPVKNYFTLYFNRHVRKYPIG